jgi:hypothetical protein
MPRKPGIRETGKRVMKKGHRLKAVGYREERKIKSRGILSAVTSPARFSRGTGVALCLPPASDDEVRRFFAVVRKLRPRFAKIRKRRCTGER